MREEIQRISKLVSEGKLSPEDAADLIEAFYSNEPAAASPKAEPSKEETSDVPPPPPTAAKDPLKSILGSIEKLVNEGKDSVNWDEVSKQAKSAAKQSIDRVKVGLEEISKGKVNLGWLNTQATREISLPLALENGKTLRIENSCGDVKIVGGFDSGNVSANAKIRGSSYEDAKLKADGYTLIIEESDHQVLIRQPDVAGLCVDLEIQLPGSSPVEVRVDSGDVQVLDTKSSARIVSRSGDVRLRGLNGPVEVTAESGDILAQDCTTPSLAIENKSGDITLQRVIGNINARTAGGDVVVETSSGKVISVESVSGNVRVDLEQAVNGNLNIRTVSGHASVAVPDGCDCRVSLSTLRGSVLCSFELQDEAKAEQRVTGRLGTGSGTLDVSAVTGSISLEMHNAAVE